MSRKISSSQYDVVIIGAGLGGLISAAVIAKKGFRVLVVEKNSYPGGCCSSFSKDGYIFNFGPSLFWGLDRGGPLYNLFEYLGIQESIKTQNILRRIDPGIQIVLPDHRLDIYTERERLFEELKREFPKYFKTLREFYNRVDYINSEIFEAYSNYPFNIKREGDGRADSNSKFLTLLSRDIKRMSLPASIRNFFTRYSWDISIKDFFSLQTLFFGQVDSSAASLPFFTRVLTIPLKGLYYPLSGSQGFANLLADKVFDLGGEIKYNVNVKSLLFDRKKAKGIRYDEGVISKSIHAKKIIANTSIFNLKDSLISEELPRKRLVKKFKDIKGRWTIFSLFLGVESKAVPEPMKENLLMYTDSYEAPEERRMLYVHTSPEWDRKRAPAGKRALTALSVFPVENWKGDEEELKKKNREKIIADLKRIIPFIEGNFNIVDMMTPPKFEKLLSRPEGIVGNLNGGYKKNRFNFYGLSHNLPLKNLYLVGEEAYPGYGTTNVMFSGFHAAERIIEDLK